MRRNERERPLEEDMMNGFPSECPEMQREGPRRICCFPYGGAQEVPLRDLDLGAGAISRVPHSSPMQGPHTGTRAHWATK